MFAAEAHRPLDLRRTGGVLAGFEGRGKGIMGFTRGWASLKNKKVINITIDIQDMNRYKSDNRAKKLLIGFSATHSP